MTRTILLADDSVTIQKVVELTFLDEDVRVVAFGNGSDAIDRLDEVRPDVIVADVHMPGADGYEVAAAARQRLPGVPVLLLVGTFEVFDSARAGESGAVGHLKKPFDSQELLRRVQELLASSRPAAAAEAAPATEPAAGEPVFEPISDEDAARAASWSFEPVGEAPAEEAATAAAEEIWGGPAPAEPQPFEPPPIELPHPLAGSARAAEPAAAAPAPEFFVQAAGGRPLSEEEVDRIARRVIELGGERIVRDIAWEVVPDLAEVLLKARIRELEASVE